MRFADTNVLLYAISRDPKEREKAARANEVLAARDIALSVPVLQEFYVQATRESRPDPLTHEQASGLVESFLRFPVQAFTTDLTLAATPPCCATSWGRAPGGKPLLEAIDDYEAEMVPYGFARVADSLAQNGTSGDDPLYKPVIGRAMLAATRGYFRAVDRIPALRRKFLNSLYTYRGS